MVHRANSCSLSLDIIVGLPWWVSRPSADEYSSNPLLGALDGASLGLPIAFEGKLLILLVGPLSRRLGRPDIP